MLSALSAEAAPPAALPRPAHNPRQLFDYVASFGEREVELSIGGDSELSGRRNPGDGCSRVYRGWLSGAPVAVKCVPLPPGHGDDAADVREKVLRELLIQQRLRDPRVLQVYGSIEMELLLPSPGRKLGIVMELADTSVQKLLEQPGYKDAMPLSRRLRLLWTVASLLERMHSGTIPVHVTTAEQHGGGSGSGAAAGGAAQRDTLLLRREPGIIVHGDLKPGNILLKNSGSPCLTDFRFSAVRSTRDNTTIVGHPRSAHTLWYAHESILRGEPGPYTPTTDLYAFGWVVMQVLTGEPHLVLLYRIYELAVLGMQTRGMTEADAHRRGRDVIDTVLLEGRRANTEYMLPFPEGGPQAWWHPMALAQTVAELEAGGLGPEAIDGITRILGNCWEMPPPPPAAQPAAHLVPPPAAVAAAAAAAEEAPPTARVSALLLRLLTLALAAGV